MTRHLVAKLATCTAIAIAAAVPLATVASASTAPGAAHWENHTYSVRAHQTQVTDSLCKPGETWLNFRTNYSWTANPNQLTGSVISVGNPGGGSHAVGDELTVRGPLTFTFDDLCQ